MKLYCANCGKPLRLIRKAVPSKGITLDLVEYHECSEEIIPIDLSNLPNADHSVVEGKDKFVQSLNDLKPAQMKERRTLAMGTGTGYSEGKLPRPSPMTGTDDLRDRRFDQDAKSTAPLSVIDHIKSMSNSIPERQLNEPSDDSEMGG